MLAYEKNMVSMKFKSIALVLILAMLLPCVPVFSVAEGALDAPDVSPKYDIDTFYMNEENGGSSPSSGSDNRWNSSSNVTRTNIADPQDASNQIVSVLASAGKTGYMRKNVYMGAIPTEGSLTVSIDVKVPSPTDDASTQTVAIKLFGQSPVTLTYNASTGKFDGTYYGEKFTVACDQWIRFYNIIEPNTGLTSASIQSQLSGNMLNQEGTAISYLQKDTVFSMSSKTLELHVSGASGKKGLVYFDNMSIFKAGDFGEAVVSTDSFGDYYGNFNLSGNVTLKLYHTIDMATLDLNAIRVCDKLSQTIPYTSLTVSHDARTFTFNFAGNKLPKFEDVYFCFGDTIRDLYGNAMYEPTVILATLGDNAEVPPPPDVIEVPSNGFVMPDQWNTGYRCDKSELVPLAEKYPEVVANGNVIDEKIARLYNYEFSYFSHTAGISVIATSPVYIHDFYMNGGGFSNGKSGKNTSSERLTIAWGEGEGSKGDFFGGGNMTISHCYIHDVGADHMKGTSGHIVEFNYFRDGGTRNPGAHADVVQFMGDLNGKKAGVDAKFYGNRFDAPHMGYDHVANCCFFFKPEAKSVGYVNVQSIGNWFNGGGYTTYLTPACDKSLCQQIYYNDNKWGYGHNFGAMNYDGSWVTTYNGSYENNGYVTELQTGSVVYYSGTGENANRVYKAEDIDSTEGRVMVNLANYMTIARGFAIEVEVLDSEGNVVTSAQKTGTVRRYTPVKEYMVSSNLRDTGLKNPENGSTIYELIEKPDLPHDVPEYVELENLPADMENHTISVKVYDTTKGRQLIRTSTLGLEVYDDCRPNESGNQDTYYSVTFKDTDGNVLAIQSVKKGENAIAPEAPVKEGFVFIGWSGSITNVQSDITVTAKYVVDEPPVYYTVTFKDAEGNILSTETVRKGLAATAPTPPERYGYEFTGWSANFSNVQGDLVITPKYEKLDMRSQALKNFDSAVSVAEGAAKSSLLVRLAKIQSAYDKWLLVDANEEGAAEAYARLEAIVNAYNRDIALYNGAMADAESVSQTVIKCSVPERND